MSKLSPEQLKLITQIETAFKDDPPRPEEAVTLLEAIADDDWLSKEEQLAMRKFDTDQLWQDVPDQKMLDNQSPFSFLNQKGARYYLPAYMRLGIKFPLEADHAASMLLLHLYPWTNTQGEKSKMTVRQIAKSLDLNKEQCKAVHDFIHYFKSDPEIPNPELKEALDEWKKLSE